MNLLEKPSYKNFQPIIIFTGDGVKLWSEIECKIILQNFYKNNWTKEPISLRDYHQWTSLNTSIKYMYIWTTLTTNKYLALVRKTLWNNYAWYRYLKGVGIKNG